MFDFNFDFTIGIQGLKLNLNENKTNIIINRKLVHLHLFKYCTLPFIR